MTTNDTRKDLLTKLTDIRKDITELRIKLNAINEKKETHFEAKEKISKEIHSTIGSIQSLKRERDSFTRQVRELKDKRRELNSRIRGHINKIKELNSEKKDISKKFNITVNPHEIEENLKKLEYKIETEALPFSEEKKIMKKVHELKKELGDSKRVSDVWDRIRKVSQEIDESKKEANSAHALVQENAEKSQQKHEELVELSKKIEELKAKEREEYNKFSKFKEQFLQINNALKDKLIEMNTLNDIFRNYKSAKKKEREQQDQITLKQKTEIVEEKIKTKRKLTTEDLLVFQKKAIESDEEVQKVPK